MSKKLEETIELILGDDDSASKEASSEPTLLSPAPPSAVPPSLLAGNIVVTYATGAYLYPTYLDELIVPRLSLSEQALFHQIYRLSQKLSRTTEKISLSSLAKACGLSPELASSSLKSLVRKRILKVVHKNPFTKKAKYRLVLPKELRKNLILCGICHEMIKEGEAWKYCPVAKTDGGRVQCVVAHKECIRGNPLERLDGEEEDEVPLS